ncbi:cytochrome P450 [Actinacidiphila acididurans]|uniref:Cytochrome P450 n=1 Tax=Actinacidiphila acididurans TaxID=2784346 RepID=A0ABS2TTA9_9ACTN|nr:cytochrome P450 [Actinacidiphila acididurans]MBM9506563.1 cytochrome P450 [Actinacidiphila acididurans]
MVTLAELAADPHPHLARLRAQGPVVWVPALGGWMVTGRAAAVEVMRDAAAFTVDDPRFTTAQVVGASMLSLDGSEHARHREPFVEPFRPRAVHAALGDTVRGEADRLLDGFAAQGAAELRRDFAGPLAAAVMAEVLGLTGIPVAGILSWYDAIVQAVDRLTQGQDAGSEGPAAYAALREAVAGTLDAGASGSLLARAAADGRLTVPELASNAAVLLFGGIETTEAMIANALLHVLSAPETAPADLLLADPDLLDSAIEESLRLEPGAAVVDRYATGDVELAGARIRAGDLVTVSLAGANRDPDVFTDPDRFDIHRPNTRLQLAFAHGPHYCVGAHLARLEARTALRACFERLPGLRLDERSPSAPRGLVFRKPPTLAVVWDR